MSWVETVAGNGEMRAETLAARGVAFFGASSSAIVLGIAKVVYRALNVLFGLVGLQIVRRATLEKLVENSGSTIGVGGLLDESEIDLIGELREIEAQFAREMLADARSQAKRAMDERHRLIEALEIERRRSQELSDRLERLASLDSNGFSNGRDHYAGRPVSMVANLESLKSEQDAELSLS